VADARQGSVLAPKQPFLQPSELSEPAAEAWGSTSRQSDLRDNVRDFLKM